MKIACNYYLETEELFDEGRIHLDYFKYPALGFQMEIMKDLDAFEGLCSRIAQKRPILLHGLYPAPHDLSSATLKEDFDDRIADRLVETTKTPGLSFHPALSKKPERVPFGAFFETIVDNARYIKEKYEYLEFVLIENCDNVMWGELIKPDVFSRLVHESGCGLLLDISHAFCAAKWLDMPFYEYMEKLPLDKTVEVHINGWIEIPGAVMCHTMIHEEGYKALEFVLDRCRPEIVIVEYGRDNDKIGAGIPLVLHTDINEKIKEEIEIQMHRVWEIVKSRAN